MEGIVRRLTSRKLWLTIAAFITFIVNGQYTEAVLVVSAYLGMQGVQDVVGQRYNAPEIIKPTSQNVDDEEEVDKTVIETGNVGTPLFNEQTKEDDK